MNRTVRLARGRRPRVRSRGMALVETLIASVILSIVTTSVISSLIFASRSSRITTNAVMAKNLAQGYFERM